MDNEVHALQRRLRYHTAKGLPPLPLPEGVFPLTYSKHALLRAQEKHIWLHRLPAFLDTHRCELVDIETEDGLVVACAYRRHWTPTTDLVLVCQVDSSPWLVRTLYTNHKHDRHPTLNLDSYCTPGEEHLWTASAAG